MRNNIILFTLIVGLPLSGCLTALAGQNPQPEASARQAKQEPAKTDQAAGGQTEGQSAGPGAQARAHANDRALGTITSVGVDRLEIKKMDGTAQTVMVDDQTRYRGGRRDAQKDLHLEDLKPGDHVFVQGRASDNKEFTALMVRRVTDEEIQAFSGERAFGEIISIDGNQIKVRNPRQGEKTVVVNDQTVFMKEGQPITLKDLKVGDRIFAQGKETNGQFIAARIFTGQFRQQGQQWREHRTRPENR